MSQGQRVTRASWAGLEPLHLLRAVWQFTPNIESYRRRTMHLWNDEYNLLFIHSMQVWLGFRLFFNCSKEASGLLSRVKEQPHEENR